MSIASLGAVVLQIGHSILQGFGTSSVRVTLTLGKDAYGEALHGINRCFAPGNGRCYGNGKNGAVTGDLLWLKKLLLGESCSTDAYFSVCSRLY